MQKTPSDYKTNYFRGELTTQIPVWFSFSNLHEITDQTLRQLRKA